MAKRVAVIGAGPSGLVTMKELLDAGHEPTCLEKAGGLGGVFRFGENDGVHWDSCRLTSSGTLTAFSDFPPLASEAGHMTAAAYAKYLGRYAEWFGLLGHIRFATRVAAVSKVIQDGREVRTVDERGTRIETYDAVAVCSGLNEHPHRLRGHCR